MRNPYVQLKALRRRGKFELTPEMRRVCSEHIQAHIRKLARSHATQHGGRAGGTWEGIARGTMCRDTEANSFIVQVRHRAARFKQYGGTIVAGEGPFSTNHNRWRDGKAKVIPVGIGSFRGIRAKDLPVKLQYIPIGIGSGSEREKRSWAGWEKRVLTHAERTISKVSKTTSGMYGLSENAVRRTVVKRAHQAAQKAINAAASADEAPVVPGLVVGVMGLRGNQFGQTRKARFTAMFACFKSLTIGAEPWFPEGPAMNKVFTQGLRKALRSG